MVVAASLEAAPLTCLVVVVAFQVGSSLSLSRTTSTMGVWVQFKALTNSQRRLS